MVAACGDPELPGGCEQEFTNFHAGHMGCCPCGALSTEPVVNILGNKIRAWQETQTQSQLSFGRYFETHLFHLSVVGYSHFPSAFLWPKDLEEGISRLETQIQAYISSPHHTLPLSAPCPRIFWKENEPGTGLSLLRVNTDGSSRPQAFRAENLLSL